MTTRLLQAGIAELSYFNGYSFTLNWVRKGAMPVINRQAAAALEWSSQAVTDGYFDANGNISTTAPTDAVSIRYFFHTSSGNAGEVLAGEDFTVFYDGICGGVSGLSITNISAINHTTKSFTFKAANSSNWVILAIDTSFRSDPPRNVRIVQTRYLADTVIDGVTYPGWNNGGEFNPHWLHEMKKLKRLRFMDPLRTNGSPIVNYSEFATDSTTVWGNPLRNSQNQPTPTGGMSLAAICRIANATGCEVHICFPHQATDACVTSMATAMKNGTTNKVTFEYSNEVWNDGFPQKAYCAGLAASKGLTAGFSQRYYGYRAAECMKIVRDVYNDRTRWRGCLATQSVGASVTTESIVGFDKWKTDTASTLVLSDLFDDVAVTCYFGEVVGSYAISSITTGTSTTIVASGVSIDSAIVVGAEIIVAMSIPGSGMSEIHGLYGTVTAKSGNTLTVNINSTGFSAFTNDNNAFIVHSKYFRLMDESESRFGTNPTRYPTKYQYFNEQFAQLCRTGTCDFGITMSTAYVLDYMDAPTTGYWRQQKAVADTYGLELTQYEGGCHFLGSTMITGHPGTQNPIGGRFIEYQVAAGHSPEVGSVYDSGYHRFFLMGGKDPSKFVEAGPSTLIGTWGGIRYWPTFATPAGDMANPVWQAVTRASANVKRFTVT